MPSTLTAPLPAIALLLLAAPLIGGLLTGLDRKLTARLQGRMGPPVLQPFFDLLKLCSKEATCQSRLQVLYAYMYLGMIVMTLTLLVTGQDLLMAVFIHAFGSIALVLGAQSVASPYSRIGAQRRIMQILAYEPVFVLLVIGLHRITGSFMASSVPMLRAPMLFHLPLVCAAFFFCLLIKMEKSPFDIATSHHAHQELVKGITVEYSGPLLAVLEIAHYYEVFMLFAVIAFFWSTSVVPGLLLAAVYFFAQCVADTSTARLVPLRVVSFMWSFPVLLAITNVLWLYF